RVPGWSDHDGGRGDLTVAGVRTSVLAVLLTVVLGSCSATNAPTPAARSPAASPSLTVEYAPGLTEDIYLPADVKRVPLVVLIPGGGWMTADPAGLAGLAAG